MRRRVAARTRRDPRTMAMSRAPALLLVLVALGVAAPLRAQSLLAANGLGVPVPPLDARARALGGIRTGLFGFDLSLGNPADAADVHFRGGMASLQPFSRTDEVAGERATTSGARFPLLRVIFPSGRLVYSLGFGGFLDQTWGVTSTSTEQLGSEADTVRDVARATGGVSQLRAGASYLLSSHVALGAAVGLYTGSLRRELIRSFPDSVNGDFQGFTSLTQWGYHGLLASVGGRADVGSVLRVGGALTWSGTLKADSALGAAVPKSYKLPLQADFGASALLAPTLALSAGASWGGWSKTFGTPGSPSLPCPPAGCGPITNSRNAWDVGAGLEYGGVQSGFRHFPLRIGYHYSQLPFFQHGDVLPTESAAAVGGGFRVGGNPGSPAAELDGSLERGSRKGGPTATPLSETFWRLTFSLAVFGI